MRCCCLLLFAFSALVVCGQTPVASGSSGQPLASAKTELNLPAPSITKPAAAPSQNGVQPTWETQKSARAFVLGIPAPRGQIVDRHGASLAQSRVAYNLGIAFPTPLNFSDQQIRQFAEKQILLARSLTGRTISITEEQLLKHYRNRGVLPLIVAQDLKAIEIERVRQAKSDALILQPVYLRIYPQADLAGHIVGYAGRAGKTSEKPIENNDLLWPDAEGREGLEQMFDDQLQGKAGQLNISFDAEGRKSSEQITIPPQPGYNIVTTIDTNLQRLCESALARGCKRGALVIVDPNNGDVLALASWPTINPNWFIPSISQADFDRLRNDPDNPMIPRAYRSSYPPGSTFKVFVGLAAFQSGKIDPVDEFSCPAAMEIGGLTFRNWKREHSGDLNFIDALTQSCNPYFYQVGLRIGAAPIVDTAFRLGLGVRTGIPIASETNGRIPTDDYLLEKYKRRFAPGDIANLSIGQGDTLVSPLQMAQAMAAIGNGGTLFQTRLVQQVQTIDNQIVTAYDIRARGVLGIDKKTMSALRKAMIGVVSSRAGTASRASVSGVQVAGKTGTAQWGPKHNERTAAWFAGFAPADKPRYAFAAVYEGEANNDDVHGGTQAAPLIGRVLREVLKPEKKQKKKKKEEDAVDDVMDEDTPVRRAEPVEDDEDDEDDD
jgi:penicillin-binding protein 2